MGSHRPLNINAAPVCVFLCVCLCLLLLSDSCHKTWDQQTMNAVCVVCVCVSLHMFHDGFRVCLPADKTKGQCPEAVWLSASLVPSPLRTGNIVLQPIRDQDRMKCRMTRKVQVMRNNSHLFFYYMIKCHSLCWCAVQWIQCSHLKVFVWILVFSYVQMKDPDCSSHKQTFCSGSESEDNAGVRVWCLKLTVHIVSWKLEAVIRTPLCTDHEAVHHR